VSGKGSVQEPLNYLIDIRHCGSCLGLGSFFSHRLGTWARSCISRLQEWALVFGVKTGANNNFVRLVGSYRFSLVASFHRPGQIWKLCGFQPEYMSDCNLEL
jgi:hypothetical protein